MDQFGHAKFHMPAPDKIFTPVVSIILGLSIAGYAVTLYANDFVMQWLALNPSSIMRGAVWQLVTYAFFTHSPITLILDGIVVLVLGSAIEREWRSRSVFGLWLVVNIACGVLWVMVCLITRRYFTTGGLSAFAFGLMAAFGLVFRERRFLWFLVAMNAQTLSYIMIGIGVILCISFPLNLVFVLGAPVAYGYIKLRWWLAEREDDRNIGGGDYQAGGFVDID